MLFSKLDNGCEVAVRRNPSVPIAAIQVWIHAGSVHENEKQYGMAHLIEHMLFKGTKRRGVGEISKTIESRGGDVNAYTTFDRTVYYLTIHQDHMEEGLDILSDAVFESLFDAEELEREKEVVIEEIRRGNDSPANQVGRKLFESCYPKGPVGRPIIGFEESVRGFSRDDLVAFYKRWYQPGNMSIVVVGDCEESQAHELTQKYFGKHKNEFEGATWLGDDRFGDGNHVEILKADFQQPRLQISYPCPSLNERDAVYLDLAAYALGSGDLSRLTKELRDEKQIVTAIGASIYAPRFRGLFTVSAFPLEDTYLESVSSIGEVLQRYLTKEPITEAELERAKANIKVQRVLEEETVEGMARNIGFNLTTGQKVDFDDYYYDVVASASCDDVKSALQRHILDAPYTIVGMLPEGNKTTDAEVETSYRKGLESHDKAVNLVINSADTKALSSTGEIEKMEIRPGVELAYRQRMDSPLTSISMSSEGGTRGEDPSTCGSHYCFSNLMAKASRELGHPDFTARLEDIGASVDGFSGKDSFGVTAQYLDEYEDTVLAQLQAAVMEPEFTPMHWALTKQQIEQTIKSEDDQPSRIAIREFKKLVYGKHPYQFNLYGSQERIDGFDPESLLNFYTSVRDQGRWSIGAVGPQSGEDFAKKLQKTFAKWEVSSKSRSFQLADDCREQLPKAERMVLEKDREQTHIVVGYRGLAWNDQDREALDVLTSILGGMGGRLFLRLRDQNSLAYTVAPLTSHGVHPGIFACYIACAPEKTEMAREQLHEEIQKTQNSLASHEEMSRSIEYIMGNHDSEYQQGDSQAMTMSLMNLFGVGADDFIRYRERLRKVSAQDVQKVAQRLFKEENLLEVIVGKQS